MTTKDIYLGNSKLEIGQDEVTGKLVQFENEDYYKISNSDLMRPFFMSIVSYTNHWMFISSNGGLSAGRKDSEHALFPYYSDDKITNSKELTGTKTIFHITKNNKTYLWEPFSSNYRGIYNITRNLYKNSYGNKVVFEEVNHDLKLTFIYQWNSSNHFGFVKKSSLQNNDDSEVSISMVDGLQNILPAGVETNLQNSSSNLVDAYKRSELLKETGIGIFALSAFIVDKAEPSESLKANIAWSLGLENPTHLLSTLQLDKFRRGAEIKQETDVKAEKGAFFIQSDFKLNSNTTKEWMILADVNQNHSSIAKISDRIKNEGNLYATVKENVETGTANLIKLCAASDGLQATNDVFRNMRHYSNTLFNIMRGGIFDDNYQIEKSDFEQYLEKASIEVYNNSQDVINSLPEIFSLSQLKAIVEKKEDKGFERLSLEYLPLKFSRRHGDPSRPWNIFSINTKSEKDGSKILDYQGNWRDIFQNWEALVHSYPKFIDGMIHKFLNATTFDGYNPYRVTKDGFDWETIEPDDPWSYLGYWGDHQIIYLLKFLEFIEDHEPGKLADYFNKELFVYANVPYKIKSYQDTLKNPKDTIDFDHQLDEKIRERREVIGADGALLRSAKDEIYTVNFIEKTLATVLAKMSNFIPEGGIWMNTQRPEWNDANNALVGNGVSMVTLSYLRRFLGFFENIVSSPKLEETQISEELLTFFNGIVKVLDDNTNVLSGKVSDVDRKTILDGLGTAGSEYREAIYKSGFSGTKSAIELKRIQHFISVAIKFLDHSIDANKRSDNLYHTYNLMEVKNGNEIAISYLDEMLEGQVAVLSSGKISSKDAISLLDSLKDSKLFREDQYSYLLYPNKELPGFLVKNTVPEKVVKESQLLQQLIKDGNRDIVEKDVNGTTHFNGRFHNAKSLDEAFKSLKNSKYASLIEKEKSSIMEAFEEVFNHKAFTGRSGTFYGYEGLGSIYWHMVSKFLLAVEESSLKAIKENASDEVVGRLLEHFYEINEGIGVHKSPTLYGAFPTDPYSHTPAGKGAQQPGMTGQVKEDILSRFGELGVFVKDGKIGFKPSLLRKEEFLSAERSFEYITVSAEKEQIQLDKDSLCFTYCQVPIIYKISKEESLKVVFNDKSHELFESLSLDKSTSDKLFGRTAEIDHIMVSVKQNRLK